MEDKIEKVLNNFINKSEVQEDNELKDKNFKTVIINDRQGLIERIDRKFIDNQGRMLLREQY